MKLVIEQGQYGVEVREDVPADKEPAPTLAIFYGQNGIENAKKFASAMK